MKYSKKALNNFIKDFNKEPDEVMKQIKKEMEKLK